MRLTRVYADALLTLGSSLELSDSAGAHLVRVLRLTVGQKITVFDGRGCEMDAHISVIRGTRVTVVLEGLRHSVTESALSLTLLQSISRAERMDWTIQKATELGVRRIVPLKTEHTIVRLDAQAGEKKRAHWAAIAAAACEQCGRAVVPSVDSPITLPEYLARLRQDDPSSAIKLALDPESSVRLHALGGLSGGASLLVGPEGGLSANELRLALNNGFTGLRLGPRIMRTETAAIATLAALQTLYGDFAL